MSYGTKGDRVPYQAKGHWGKGSGKGYGHGKGKGWQQYAAPFAHAGLLAARAFRDDDRDELGFVDKDCQFLNSANDKIKHVVIPKGYSGDRHSLENWDDMVRDLGEAFTAAYRTKSIGRSTWDAILKLVEDCVEQHHAEKRALVREEMLPDQKFVHDRELEVAKVLRNKERDDEPLTGGADEVAPVMLSRCQRRVADEMWDRLIDKFPDRAVKRVRLLQDEERCAGKIEYALFEVARRCLPMGQEERENLVDDFHKTDYISRRGSHEDNLHLWRRCLERLERYKVIDKEKHNYRKILVKLKDSIFKPERPVSVTDDYVNELVKMSKDYEELQINEHTRIDRATLMRFWKRASEAYLSVKARGTDPSRFWCQVMKGLKIKDQKIVGETPRGSSRGSRGSDRSNRERSGSRGRDTRRSTSRDRYGGRGTYRRGSTPDRDGQRYNRDKPYYYKGGDRSDKYKRERSASREADRKSRERQRGRSADRRASGQNKSGDRESERKHDRVHRCDQAHNLVSCDQVSCDPVSWDQVSYSTTAYDSWEWEVHDQPWSATDYYFYILDFDIKSGVKSGEWPKKKVCEDPNCKCVLGNKCLNIGSHLTCGHCKKQGHTKYGCWGLYEHLLPEKFADADKKKGKRDGSSGSRKQGKSRARSADSKGSNRSKGKGKSRENSQGSQTSRKSGKSAGKSSKGKGKGKGKDKSNFRDAGGPARRT